MHRNYASRLSGDGRYGPRHLELKFEEFEFGHIYKRVREDTDHQHPHWTIGVTALWPHAFFLGDHIEWRIPVDDDNTLSITWMFHRVPKNREPYEQARVPYWTGPTKNAAGRWITSHVLNQDIMAWAGQGRVTDRTQEHLGRSDAGIIMLRRCLEQNIKIVELDEGDPKAVIRDPERNTCLELPIKHKELFTTSMSLEESRQLGDRLAYRLNRPDYQHQLGQPQSVKLEYQIAMGIVPEDATEPI
jgi:5,5'-dehydrodivanillate O-demethylase